MLDHESDNLYLQHVSRVGQYVRKKHDKIPIIWDDMLRNIPEEKINKYQLGQIVEIMVNTLLLVNSQKQIIVRYTVVLITTENRMFNISAWAVNDFNRH